MKILIVEPDEKWQDLLVFLLAKEGHATLEAVSQKQGLEIWVREEPDLVMIANQLPDGQGLALCQTLRKESATVLVILLGDDREEKARIEALEAGAEEYIVKPFSPALLIARIRSLERWVSQRAEPVRRSRLEVGSFTLDAQQLEVTRDAQRLRLTPIQFSILYTLALYKGVVLSPQRILELVWGYEDKGDTYLLRSHIHHLRKVIEPDPIKPRYLVTVRGVGYSFRPEG